MVQLANSYSHSSCLSPSSSHTSLFSPPNNDGVHPLTNAGDTFMNQAGHPERAPIQISLFIAPPGFSLLRFQLLTQRGLQMLRLLSGAADQHPRLRCLWTSGFDHILLFCKICYLVWRSAAVHQKYNSVTNPASS